MSGPMTVKEIAADVHQWKQASEAAQRMELINGQLWALASFDGALQHFVELRQKFDGMPEDHRSRVSLERALSQYIEYQCLELVRCAPGVDTLTINTEIDSIIGHAIFTDAIYHVLGVTNDPLAVEILTYAAYLTCFTAQGSAPWTRTVQVGAECFYQKHPLARSTYAS